MRGHVWCAPLLQKLPPCHSPSDCALVDDFALEWHLAHYSMEADIQARAATPDIQHLSFLYGVRAWVWAPPALGLRQLCSAWVMCERARATRTFVEPIGATTQCRARTASTHEYVDTL